MLLSQGGSVPIPLAEKPAFAISRRKVEALFAGLKNYIGLRRLRLRRMRFVHEQFYLAATAQSDEMASAIPQR